MTRTGLRTLYCGAAIALMSAAAAQAQESTAGKATQLDEVVITAMRTETDLQETPVAVTAMSGETLRGRNMSSLLDITSYVPSLSIGSRSGTSTASGGVSIRGMGVDATASSAAVGIYVDEVYLPSGAGNLLGLFDVDRVEVLRGPQGTLFGRNTIAGAIQYVTAKPEQEFGGYVAAIGGSYNRVDVQGALNVPLGDTFAVRISGASTARSGFVHDNFNDTERGADRTREARIQALWTPTDRLSINLKGEVITERTNGRAVTVSEVNPNAQFVGLAILFGETRPLNSSYVSTSDYSNSGFNAPDYFRFNYSEAQAIINYDVTDDIVLKSITAYSSSRSRMGEDFDNTPLSILGSTPAIGGLEVFTQELQLSNQASDARFRWTLGAYYYDSEERQNPGQGIVLGFGPILRPYGNPATDITSEAVYGQATYDLTDRLSATVGLRYSHEENTGWLQGATTPVSASFNDTSPHFGLDFKATDDVMFYVKASKGFRAGGITPNAALPGGGLAYQPETAWTYEAGARMEFLDRRLRINPTVYFTDWKNIQFNVLIPTPTTVVAATDNAGDARIKGFELETQFAATDRLLLTGSMSLMDGEYTRVGNLIRFEFPFGFLASFPDPLTGAVLPGSTLVLPNLTLNTPLQRAPKSKFSVGARYSYPLANDSQIVGSLDYAWTAKQNSAVTISDAIEMPAYGLLSARLQYDAPGRRWSLAAFATNLTDEYYLVGGVDFAGGYTVGTKELDVGRPRELGIELRARF